ncbi:flagellar hook-associated protein 1 FlgK [Lachnospiraceae bacterium C10]|nr:flagellar hook-associated protein 1 FlgK [Lachnospiraceae bacterium C10]
MSSTFFGLHVAKSGLNAFQASINTTANNISNVQTEGYSKQVTNLSESSALRSFQRYGSVSTGVSTDSVSRLRDQYYNTKYWNNQSSYGFYNQKSYYMNQIEEYFKDDTATNPGFSTVFSKMFNALDQVQSNAGDTSIRNEFISDATELCTYFNFTSNRLKELQSSANDEVKSTVDTINNISQKIALLNKQINLIETGQGQPPANELRDQRELLVDQLSSIIAIDCYETKVKNSNYPDMDTGATYYSIKVNGKVLVDNYEYNELAVKTREYKHNQSDVDGLYDIQWAETGMNFDVWGINQKGSLRGLFEIRDGNDEQNLKGTAELVDDGAGGTHPSMLRITYPSNTEVDTMNLPEQGVITVNGTEYAYESFEAQTNEQGEIVSYTFSLEHPIPGSKIGKIAGNPAIVGQTVNFKGIAYYQNQMNNFARSFARAFNKIVKSGQDLNGDAGVAFFVSNDKVMNREGDFVNSREQDDVTSVDADYYKLDSNGDPVLDAKGNKIINDLREMEHAIGSTKDAQGNVTYTGGVIKATDDSYYRLTASSFAVNSVVSYNPSKFVTTINKEYNGNKDLGRDAADLVKELNKLESNVTMYRGGTADKFLQRIYADVTVDTQESENFTRNFENIRQAIDQQRQSISGVDEDEEAMNLVKFQNAYNLNAKVISTLAEMYDQLILNTGV